MLLVYPLDPKCVGVGCSSENVCMFSSKIIVVLNFALQCYLSDGENSITTSVSDVHGEESPPSPNGEVDSSNVPDENPCSDIAETAAPTDDKENTVIEEDVPSQEFPIGEESMGPECDEGLEVSGSDVSADNLADDGMDGEDVVRNGAFYDGCGDDERSPEHMLLALSVEGQKALRSEGRDSDDSSSSVVDGDSTDGNGSIVGTSIVRALFCEEIPAQNDQEVGSKRDGFRERERRNATRKQYSRCLLFLAFIEFDQIGVPLKTLISISTLRCHHSRRFHRFLIFCRVRWV